MRVQKEGRLSIGNFRKRRACYSAAKNLAEFQLCPKTSGRAEFKAMNSGSWQKKSLMGKTFKVGAVLFL